MERKKTEGGEREARDTVQRSAKETEEVEPPTPSLRYNQTRPNEAGANNGGGGVESRKKSAASTYTDIASVLSASARRRYRSTKYGVCTVEVATSALSVAAFAAAGMVMRTFLTHLATTQLFASDTADAFLPASLLPNMVGSLLMGVLVGLQPWIERHHAPLFVGLSVGLCGSITTFGSMMLESSSVSSLNYIIFNTSTLPTVSNGTAIYIRSPAGSIASIFVSLSLSYSALVIGRHVADESTEKWRGVKGKPPTPDRQKYVHVIIASSALLVLSILAAIVLLVFSPPSTYTSLYISVFFSPLGALVRYALSFANKKRAGKHMPVGTLLANCIGTIVAVVCYQCLVFFPLSPFVADTISAASSGFGSCLSTVSSLVKELAAGSRRKMYAYFFCTLLLCTSVLYGMAAAVAITVTVTTEQSSH